MNKKFQFYVRYILGKSWKSLSCNRFLSEQSWITEKYNNVFWISGFLMKYFSGSSVEMEIMGTVLKSLESSLVYASIHIHYHIRFLILVNTAVSLKKCMCILEPQAQFPVYWCLVYTVYCIRLFLSLTSKIPDMIAPAN